jgi:hypothetical protein
MSVISTYEDLHLQEGDTKCIKSLVVGRFGSELGPNPNPSGPNPGSGFRFGYLPEPEPRLGSGFGKFPKFENPFELGSNPEPLINLLVLNYGPQ